VAKRYFAESGIAYAERDIITDLEARRHMALMTGQFGVPVIEIGEHAMIGWNPEEFERLRSGRFKHR
jgi:glutaredoxin